MAYQYSGCIVVLIDGGSGLPAPQSSDIAAEGRDLLCQRVLFVAFAHGSFPLLSRVLNYEQLHNLIYSLVGECVVGISEKQ